MHYTSSTEPFATLLLTLYISVLWDSRKNLPPQKNFLDLFIYEFLGFFCFRPQQNIKITTRHELCISRGWDEAPGGTRGCPSACLLKNPLLWQTCPPAQEAHHSTSSVPEGETASHTFIQPTCQSKTHIHSIKHQKAKTHTHTHCIITIHSTPRLHKSCKQTYKQMHNAFSS